MSQATDFGQRIPDNAYRTAHIGQRIPDHRRLGENGENAANWPRS